MSPGLVLDLSRARWLAGLDPALARLPKALPPSPGPWLLHDVRWEPGSGCRLAYRTRPARSAPTFVSVELRPDEWFQREYRDDPGIPGLATASRPVWVAERLAQTWGEPVIECRVEPVRYRPGSHCVLRYVVRTASASRTVHAKVFRSDRFGDVVAAKTALAATADGARLVPPVVAVWRDSGVVVEETVPGRNASAVLGDPCLTAVDRARLAQAVGQLLADLHHVCGVVAPRRSASDQLVSLAATLAPVRSADRNLGERLTVLLEVLEESLPEQGAPVLAHGGFRTGQVMVDDQGLVILDTDGLCRCDVGLDLGSSMAHLRWQAVRRPEQRRVLLGAERAILAGYESRAGTIDPTALLWWRAVGLLQVAARRYRRLEVDAWPAVPALVEYATDLMLTRHARSAGATNLLDPMQMTGVLRLGLTCGGAGSSALEVETAEVLGNAAGRRAVVRYRLRGADGDDMPVMVVGKTFTEARRARLLHENLRLLSSGPLGSGSYRVPEPLGLLTEQRLVVYRHCEGEPLDRVTDPARAADGIRRAAQWLARLHMTDVRLPRTFSVPTEKESTRQWATLVARLHPHLADDARALARDWGTAAQAMPPGRTVPIHKDFHAGHVLIGEATWVIDLDEARQGDPALDLAHFCAYLETLPGSRRGERSLFLDEYSAITGWRDEPSLAPFLAYAWLKIAKQWASGSGPWRGASPARRAAGASQALRKGRQCMNG